MAEEEESSEKSFEATPRKLEDARKRGEIPLSQDLLTASVYLGVLIAAVTVGPSSVSGMGQAMMALFERSDTYSGDVFFGSARPVFNELIWVLLREAVAWFAVPLGLVAATAYAQRAFVFAPTKLAPKLSRISPISVAKQKFGRDGWFNFFKSFVKLCVFSVVLIGVMIARSEDILASPVLSFEGILTVLADLCFVFMASAFLATATIGLLDYLWQRAEHLRKHRMTLKELRDEAKDTEGDPHTKQARRQKAQELATNRMMIDVVKADVVIVNPTHFAVALKWHREGPQAPICVAKGVDEIARQIRLRAIEAGVPIQSDPEAARAVYATVAIGEEIHREHYRAVAAAIKFADEMRAKARAGRGSRK